MRPTITCAVIAKNEEHNIRTWYASVEGCFDEYVFVDTGSTDKTVEIAKELGLKVFHFDWVNDFSAARNFSFEQATQDYIFWNDLDDSLTNKEEFKLWRDTTLATADYWIAAYHYASDKEGNPACSFARERVVRNNKKFHWKYFVHEGILPNEKGYVPRTAYVQTWAIKHRRTEEDLKRDKGRNLKLFKEREDKLDARMKFYYGKEQFENGDPISAVRWLLEAISDESLEAHDRALGIQYCVYALVQTNQLDRAVQVALNGVHLFPHRAEYWVSIADCFLKQQKVSESLPFYNAAKSCSFVDSNKSNLTTPLFNHRDAYTTYPRNQIARVWATMGNVEAAREEALACMQKYPNEESKKILDELEKAIALQSAGLTNKNTSDDIVISGLPNGFYEWDWEIYKKKGIGGSETAAVEMAYWLNKLSGRKVKVFNNRSSSRSFDGVDYIPAQEIPHYFAENKPYFHVAWRHNFKLTESPTYVWCHDLITPGAENTHYTKILALSQFHKNFLRSMLPIPENKIRVTKNGIDPARFGQKVAEREPVVVFRSSPDRGLVRTVRVLDIVRKEMKLDLKVFYGFDNMYKNGATQLADSIKEKIARRDWVHMIGNVDQKTLTEECSRSMIWLYPTDFAETYCISAIESLCEGVYPIVRRFGALADTLHDAEKEGMCTMLDDDCETEEQIYKYAQEVISAVRQQKWKKVSVDPEKYSWRQVAQEWLQSFEEDRNG